MTYGGFWRRLLASIVDGLVILAFFLVLFRVIFPLFGGSTIARFLGLDAKKAVDVRRLWQTFSPIVKFCWFLVGVVPLMLYFSMLESSKWEATLGKRILGMRVVDLQNARIGFGRASARYWIKIIFSIFWFVSPIFLMIAFTKRKQGPHDVITKTMVVRG